MNRKLFNMFDMVKLFDEKQLTIEYWVKRYGLPIVIQMDEQRRFISHIYYDLNDVIWWARKNNIYFDEIVMNELLHEIQLYHKTVAKQLEKTHDQALVNHGKQEICLN